MFVNALSFNPRFAARRRDGGYEHRKQRLVQQEMKAAAAAVPLDTVKTLTGIADDTEAALAKRVLSFHYLGARSASEAVDAHRGELMDQLTHHFRGEGPAQAFFDRILGIRGIKTAFRRAAEALRPQS